MMIFKFYDKQNEFPIESHANLKFLEARVLSAFDGFGCRDKLPSAVNRSMKLILKSSRSRTTTNNPLINPDKVHIMVFRKRSLVKS